MAGIVDTPVKSCSIGFDDPAYDETGHAEAVARRYATEHHARTVTVDDFDLIPTLMQAFDEPFADASALPTYRVSQLARETVKVALSGRSEEHTSELQSLMRISYAVFCLKNKKHMHTLKDIYIMRCRTTSHQHRTHHT